MSVQRLPPCPVRVDQQTPLSTPRQVNKWLDMVPGEARIFCAWPLTWRRLAAAPRAVTPGGLHDRGWGRAEDIDGRNGSGQR